MRLTYDDARARARRRPTPTSSKRASSNSCPAVRVVQAVEFVSDDPAFAGTMLMTWSLEPVDEGTLVTFRADDVPPGISAEDHAAGFAASLANLARFVE